MRGLNDSARASCGCAWMHSGCASAFKLNAAGAADAAPRFITSRLHHSVVACNNYYVDLLPSCGFRTCCLAKISFVENSAREV